MTIFDVQVRSGPRIGRRDSPIRARRLEQRRIWRVRHRLWFGFSDQQRCQVTNHGKRCAIGCLRGLSGTEGMVVSGFKTLLTCTIATRGRLAASIATVPFRARQYGVRMMDLRQTANTACDYCSRKVNQLITAKRAAEPRRERSSMTLARLKGTPTARSAANKMITRPATTSPDIHSAFGIPRVLVVLSSRIVAAKWLAVV